MSSALNFFTTKCDGNQSPLGEITPFLQGYSMVGGLLLTIVSVATGIFGSATPTSATICALTGVSWIVGGATGYLAISAVGFVFFASMLMSAPTATFMAVSV